MIQFKMYHWDQIKCPPKGWYILKCPPDPNSAAKHVSKNNAFPFHEKICQKLELGQNGKSIYQDLVTDHNYIGSYYSVKKKSPKLYARIETPVGEEAQVDFNMEENCLIKVNYKDDELKVDCLKAKNYLILRHE